MSHEALGQSFFLHFITLMHYTSLCVCVRVKMGHVAGQLIPCQFEVLDPAGDVAGG